MKTLIVEDETRVVSFLKKGLKNANYEVFVAEDADSAEKLVAENEFGFILLDWMLPGRSGLEICQSWRQQGIEVPIIVLTARDTTKDIVTALDSGADDYIVKPFSFSELLARMRALQRRFSDKSIHKELKIEDLTLNVQRREAKRGDTIIYLSTREFSLLEYLMQNTGNVISKAKISEHVWGFTFETRTNLIEVYINHLRKKLDCGSKTPLIHTIKGAGYVMKNFNL
ncbi:MAG: DNA-binding response regulator [Calditrichaeota bacterium]|nr:MAG: DNA-binding response regulator [Calditrichota bacterium]